MAEPHDREARDKPILLVALGGNALIRKGQKGTVEEQFENLRTPLGQIASLSRDWRIIITHGNGPQVGNLLLMQECCGRLEGLPLEILVAQTQGWLGYMIESTLDSELMQLGPDWEKKLVSLISYVVVDGNDPAFDSPTKPIGPVLEDAQAGLVPYPVRRTAKGFRRVVASPRPVTIVEKNEIRTLLEQDFIVICCGGGGIPVIREGRGFQGVDAVIDKDLASTCLAGEVGVDTMLIATDVPGAALDYGGPEERFLREISCAEARRLVSEGVFPPGSMGPKVEAMSMFLENGGCQAFIGHVEDIAGTLAGKSGTRFIF